VAAALGALGGYMVAEKQGRDGDAQRRDLIIVVRAVDLDNRITMLRMLREGKHSAEEVESVEISAIVLLGTIALDQATDASQSYGVLKHVGQTLDTYTHDFPKSQFAEARHAEVAKFLAVVGSK
jgi:hypothetical protein